MIFGYARRDITGTWIDPRMVYMLYTCAIYVHFQLGPSLKLSRSIYDYPLCMSFSERSGSSILRLILPHQWTLNYQCLCNSLPQGHQRTVFSALVLWFLRRQTCYFTGMAIKLATLIIRIERRHKGGYIEAFNTYYSFSIYCVLLLIRFIII